MKKKSIILSLIILVGGLVLLSGCDKKEDKPTDDEIVRTTGGKIVDVFKEKVKDSEDMETLAKEVNEALVDFIEIKTDVVPIKKGDYIEGFNEEIKDFKSAIAIKPMITGQPFIIYIFKVENPKEFAKNLEKNANLRWNICTEADEALTEVDGDYVFFVMTKKNFGE